MAFDTAAAAKTADFVRFAYNMFQPGVLNPTPDPGIAAAGYDLRYYLQGSDFEEQQFYGYVACFRANPGDLVIAIRGTQDAAEWLLDFLAIPVLFTPDPSLGFVALGFLLIYNSFVLVTPDGVSGSCADTLSAYGPIDSVTVVGHSLGGALATLTAAQLAAEDIAGIRDKLTVYTFGSPRVGLLDFAASFDAVVKTSFRIWNSLDIVPQVPTFPYIHVSGLGDAILQNLQQLQTLIATPACEHHLTTYQWLLDPAHFSLDSDCDAPSLTSNLQMSHFASAKENTPAQLQTAGALAMYKAACGRA